MTYQAPPIAANDSADEIATGLAMLARLQRDRLDVIADYRRCMIRWEALSVAVCAALGGGAFAIAMHREGAAQVVFLALAGVNVASIVLCLWTLANKLRGCALEAFAARVQLAELERAAEDFAQAREASPKTLPASLTQSVTG